MALSLSACAGWGVPQHSLERRGVNHLKLALTEPKGLCPGHGSQLKVVALTASGERFTPRGVQGGNISWANFDLDMRGGVISSYGKVLLASDPRLTYRRPVFIHATLVHSARVKTKLNVPVRYDCAFKAWHRGKEGRARGGQGGAGPKVKVWIDVLDASSPKPIIRVRTQDSLTGRRGIIFVGPQGSLTVDASGGRGGRGAFSKMIGGPGGQGGQGGRISVYVTADAKAFLKRLKLINRGGRGGPGGYGKKGEGKKGMNGPAGKPPQVTIGPLLIP